MGVINISQLPTLFKYGRRIHAEALVNEGSLLLGTLWDYQDADKHGGGVLDPKEGIAQALRTPPEYLRDYRGKDEFLRSLENKDGSDWRAVGDDCIVDLRTNNIVRNISFSNAERCEDAYLYCLSDVADADVMKRMSDRYDSIVRIHDPRAFFKTLLAHLITTKAVAGGVPIRCHYTDKPYPIKEVSGVVIAGTKAQTYAWQQEVRFAFIAHRDPSLRHIPLARLPVTIPELRRYCSIE